MQGSNIQYSEDCPSGGKVYVQWRNGARCLGSGSYEGCFLRTFRAENPALRSQFLAQVEQAMYRRGCQRLTVLAYGDHQGDFLDEHRFYLNHGYDYVKKTWWQWFRDFGDNRTNFMTKRLPGPSTR